MKKILSAWIEQILEFDSKLEYLAYLEELRMKAGKFKVMKQNQLESGKVILRIRKQYNRNVFPEKEGDLNDIQ